MRTLGTMQTIAVRSGLMLKSEALYEARYSEYRAEKQSADRTEQNSSDNDRNSYESYFDCTCFKITERRERHDDY